MEVQYTKTSRNFYREWYILLTMRQYNRIVNLIGVNTKKQELVLELGCRCNYVTKDILRDLIIAIKQLHNNGIRHNNIKLENIIIIDGVAKLCGFGSANFGDFRNDIRQFGQLLRFKINSIDEAIMILGATHPPHPFNHHPVDLNYKKVLTILLFIYQLRSVDYGTNNNELLVKSVTMLVEKIFNSELDINFKVMIDIPVAILTFINNS